MPLIEIPPREYDYKNQKYKKTIDQHLADMIPNIEKYFSYRPFFLDDTQVKNEILADGTYPLEKLITDAATLKLNAIPIIYINSNNNTLSIIKKSYQAKLISEICIRIEPSDSTNISNFLSKISQITSIPTSNIHLIFDVKYIDDNYNKKVCPDIAKLINDLNFLNNLNSFKDISLISSSIPPSFTQGTNTTSKISRNEFNLWTSVKKLISPNLQLQYGDYCTCNPKYLIVNPFKINPALKLVYTISNNYVIYKGKSFRDYGSTQISVGVNHHIQFLISELSNVSYF